MRIQQAIQDSIEVKQDILNSTEFVGKIQQAINLIVEAYKNGKKVLFCGNGGSAADAQHLAAELSGRFYYDRKPLYAEALHVNTSYLTAVANDYSYEDIFARILEAEGGEGDILVGISTSGNSSNVLKAFEVAKRKGMHTIAFTGNGGGKMADKSDVLLAVPSKDTPRIQESHIMIGHIICEMVEKTLFPKE
ncbi:MAG: D-sedoheptulose 7-phosphate isomerase [Bacteroidales bacterium]|nr:D-sedoheptulose 7-phosphate isomerase [Bacteroidales bacterium]MDY6393305.1 D-sedoheptulose 7-phosphate isomerase [Bacteroidales bacterium]MDY6403193.1 D-sedoheptulose 7-phosphate isomerase [Bacteroidales bacterium]